MDFERIESRENRLVKSVKALMSSAKERKSSKMFVLEGMRLCRDAVLNGYSVDTVIAAEDFHDADTEKLFGTAKRKVVMPRRLFDSLCDTVNPQGILCLVKTPDTVFGIESAEKGKFIVLENTADPSNLGAVSRSAEAFGIDGLMVSSTGCDPFSPKALRASMGALLRLPVYIFGDIEECISALRLKGIKCFASVVKNADREVRQVTFPDGCAVLIGNEANGLTEKAISLCDEKITIAMRGRAESLNAAAAATVIMWEMTEGEK